MMLSDVKLECQLKALHLLMKRLPLFSCSLFCSSQHLFFCVNRPHAIFVFKAIVRAFLFVQHLASVAVSSLQSATSK